MATLSEITQQYNRDQDAKAWQRIKEARPLMELLERNAKAEVDRILGEQRWSVVAVDPFQRSAAIAEAHEKAREIPVTEEMLAAANAVWNAAVDGEPLSMDIYRAMAAAAPVELVSGYEQGLWNRIRDDTDRIAELDAENTKLREDVGYWNETADRLEAENAELKDDLSNTQVLLRRREELIDAKDAKLKSELAAFTVANAKHASDCATNNAPALPAGPCDCGVSTKTFPAGVFTSQNAPSPSTPGDLPPPPRRPDGTLAPAAKPLPALKPAEPSRRVGG